MKVWMSMRAASQPSGAHGIRGSVSAYEAVAGGVPIPPNGQWSAQLAPS